MTPAEKKAAERQRRRDSGEVRVECWLTPREQDRLAGFMERRGITTRADAIKWLINRPLVHVGRE